MHLAEPRYPLPPGRANADFKAIIRGEWHAVRVVPVWIGCSHHGKLHRRTDNGVPPGRNREEYRAPNRCGAATLPVAPEEDRIGLGFAVTSRISALARMRDSVRDRAGVSPGSVIPVQPKAARPSVLGMQGMACRYRPCWRGNESRTNRARIADSLLGGFVHGHISWRRKYIPQHRVTSGT